jgi:hypothetical protein
MSSRVDDIFSKEISTKLSLYKVELRLQQIEDSVQQTLGQLQSYNKNLFNKNKIENLSVNNTCVNKLDLLIPGLKKRKSKFYFSCSEYESDHKDSNIGRGDNNNDNKYPKEDDQKNSSKLNKIFQQKIQLQVI